MPNPNFDQIATTTLQRYRPRFADAVTDKSAVMFNIKKRGGVEEQAGGRTLVEPVIFGENTTVGSYRDFDKLPTDPQEGMTSSEYPWASLSGSLVISGRQEFINAENKTRVLSLLKGKTMQLQMTVTNEFNRQSHSDGSGNGGKDITGFAASIENGAAWNVYGGIDSNLDLWWRNQWIGFDAFASARLANTNFLQELDQDYRVFRQVLTTFYNSCMRNTDKLKLMLTGQRVHEYFESSVVINERYVKQGNMSDANLANANFENLLFKSVPVVMDNLTPNTSILASATNQELIGLNTDFIKLIIGSGRNFVMTEFVRPPDQDAKVAQMILFAQYTEQLRDLHGRMDDIDFA
jgi:hypothetical protein